MKILMVCLGNICRSPMAQGIMEHLVKERDLPWFVDSAGTSSWHIGERPDKRAIETCLTKGIDIAGQRARQFRKDDFKQFDMILTMDRSNLSDIARLAHSPLDHGKIMPITDWNPNHAISEVPDPYFDGRFDHVFDLLWDTCNYIITENT